MSHYLFAQWDGAGNLPPVMSVIRALVGAGHRVTVLGDPTLGAEAAAAGASLRPWHRAPHRTSDDPLDVVVAEWEHDDPADVMAALRDGLICGPAEAYAADVDDAVAAVRPDVVVVDEMLVGAAVAAEASGLPWATVMPNIYFLPAEGRPPFGPGFMPATTEAERTRDAQVAAFGARLWAEGLPSVNAARAARGLAPLDDPLAQMARADRVLVLSTAAFELPARFPDNVRHVGPRLDDPVWADGDWTMPPGDDPLVVASLSSSHQEQGAALARIAQALAALPVRGLVTTGPSVPPASVPAAPNVAVMARAPHADVLPHAAAVVTHAGHGTLMKALAHGLPVLCLPMGRDQDDNAARVVYHGLGERLSPAADVDEIRSALARVLARDAHRAAAERMAAAIRRDLSEDRALAELEALAAARRATALVAVPAAG